VRTTTSGLLLLLVGVAALAGFLTGNLDRWLSYLFDPAKPALTGLGGQATAANPSGSTYAGERRTARP
jgi:hypothetical protein